MNKELLKQFKALKIIYLEDDIETGLLIKNALEVYCKEVWFCTNGQEVLDIIEVRAVDLLILDISVPKVNGLQVAQKIRQNDKQLPMIVTSGHSEKQYLLPFLQLQVEGYLLKPFEFQELMGLISSYVTKKYELHGVLQINERIYFDNLNMTLNIGDEHSKLDPKEAQFLNLMFAHRGKIVSYEKIEYILYPDKVMTKTAIRTIVYALNRKFGNKLIKSISGQGYMMLD